jgi:long-chain acyl-CoA synthetase
MLSIVEDLVAAASSATSRDRCALISGPQRLSYGELLDRVARVASWCTRHLPAGSRVVVSLPNVPELVYALYGAVAAGMIVVPVDPRLHPRNLDYLLADAEPVLVIAAAKEHANFARCAWFQQVAPTFVSVGGASAAGTVAFEELLAAEPAGDLRPRSGQPALILYTTGTTGLRKGAVLAHQSLVAATRNINEFTQLEPGTTELVAMPLTHSFGLGRLRCVFAVGGTAVLQRDWTRPAVFFDLLEEHAVSSTGLVPAVCRMLVDHFSARFTQGASCRLLELGSDFLDRHYKERLLDLFPAARICMHYGLTEASRSTFIELRSERTCLDTIGRPSPNVEVQVTDDAGQRCADDVVGEIWIRADTLMNGYWRNEEQSRAALVDGWLRTGDLARRDPDGYLRLVGRRNDTFKVAGLSVAPREIEEVLGGHPGITDAAVAAAPTKAGVTGVELHAWIVPAPSEMLDLAALRKFCLERLESFKVPHHFHLVAELPRTSSGKLQRRELLSLLAPEASTIE